MCLAIQGKVIELKQRGKVAVVEFTNKETMEMPNMAEAQKGQNVLVQQGFVVEVMK